MDSRNTAATYPEVGASAGELPTGYRHVIAERIVGRGLITFDAAVDRLMSWEMHRRAGLVVRTTSATVEPKVEVVLEIGIGPWRIAAPVRVVDVVDEPRVRGFAYGTLPGHPECGEERFLIHHDSDDTVRATIRAFSRPARWFTRLGGPVARLVQDRTTARYLRALESG